MKDKNKIKKQLIDEWEEMRMRVCEGTFYNAGFNHKLEELLI